MNRIRFVFSKRGFAAFVRHVELPQLFGRVARRAGLRVEMTRGMSPRPHIVMGPALPVGVVSLCEAVEIRFEAPVTPQEAVETLNAHIPSGFCLLKGTSVSADAASLSKCCDAARYWVRTRDESRLGAALTTLSEGLERTVLPVCRQGDDGLELTMLNPSQNGPGALVKLLTASGVIGGWPDICIARLCLGRWREESGEIVPLLQPDGQ